MNLLETRGIYLYIYLCIYIFLYKVFVLTTFLISSTVLEWRPIKSLTQKCDKINYWLLVSANPFTSKNWLVSIICTWTSLNNKVTQTVYVCLNEH